MAEGRISTLLTGAEVGNSWRFHQGPLADAGTVDFDDSVANWSEVQLPHTWNALDGQDGGDDYFRGESWYRREMNISSLSAERRQYLEFGAANAVAEVYVNGVSLGQHRGGYSAFRFDATEALVKGKNLLAVRVDNSAVPDIPPLRADYTFFGGIYRDVKLVEVGDVHLDLDDLGAPGVYLDTEVTGRGQAATATLTARIRITNAAPEQRTTDVAVSVLDASGQEVERFVQDMTIAAGESREVSLGGPLDSPHLWDGVRDPYLYTVRVELAQNDRVTDVLEQPLGLRSFELSPDAGFFLNGEYLDLHGVNRHQDREGMGWAIGAVEHDEDMAFIREIGATSVRLAHYQQAQEFYDRCDREGLVVWAEIPFVDEISEGQAFEDNVQAQMRELIRQSYNHPSIVFWGIGNEQRSDDEATNGLLSRLAELTRQEDPARISTYAHCCNPERSELTAHADAIGFNTYNGWYSSNYTQVGNWADAVHRTLPDRAVALSEYGAGASLFHHTDSRQPPVTDGDFHPEEYQTYLHEATWQQLETRPFIWGKYVWNLFDFASDSRAEGDALGRNDKGLITYDRTQKKDAFFWYKANWSQKPVLHITSRRFNPRVTPTVNVKIYSNQAAVRLFVNGLEQGLEVPVDNTAKHVFLFRDVALLEGENTVEASAGVGGALTDSLVWSRQ